MLAFEKLWQLDSYIKKLSEILQEPIFLVWWVIRDALFGNITTDIDATGPFKPEWVFSLLEQKKEQIEGVIWLFHTEKYGTATILCKDNDQDISYEITPFREEWWYDDIRHPSSVKWSDSLLVDAGRRDFSVNALYYTVCGTPKSIWENASVKIKLADLFTMLENRGWGYVPSLSLLILQDKDLIWLFFQSWIYNPEIVYTYFSEQKIQWIDSYNVRVLIDPMLGLQDIRDQKLRTVGSPDDRFNEDALRILRALRFVNVWNQQIPWGKFDFSKETWESLKNNASLVEHLPKERIHQELVKVFSANNPFWYIALLDETRILQLLFPALHKTKYNEQPVRYHPFDTYTHTMLCLRHLQSINTNYLVKLWMLYHDVGKPDQYDAYAKATTVEEKQAIHKSEYNHTVVSPIYTKRDFSALWFSNKEIEEIQRYVSEHMKPWQILDAKKENQIKKMRLLYSEAWYERTKNLIDICRADRLWQYNPLQWAEIVAVDALYIQLEMLMKTEWQFTIKELAVSWVDIMHEFGLQPWPKIWNMLQKAFDWVVHQKEERNKKETILTYLQNFVNHDEKK